MASGRPSAYYAQTISTYEPYIGHEEATLLAERVDRDLEKFKAIKEDGSIIIFNLLTLLDYIHKKIIFEKTIKKLNEKRCSIIESLITQQTSKDTLRIAQERITDIMTNTTFSEDIYEKYDTIFVKKGLIDLLDNDEISSEYIVHGQADNLEDLEEELYDLIRMNVFPVKSEYVKTYTDSSQLYFDRARQQGMSIIDSLNARRQHDEMDLTLDEACAGIMDITYEQWKKTKSEAQVSFIDYPLLKARILLDMELEEYITYTPALCVAPSKISQYIPNQKPSVIVADAYQLAKSLKTYVSQSIFGEPSSLASSKENTEELKKTLAMR